MYYKHVLIPTVGSNLSEWAIADGIGLAKDIGAKVTGFHACREGRIPHPEESDPTTYEPSTIELEAGEAGKTEQTPAFRDRGQGARGRGA